MEKKSQKLYPTDYNLFTVQDLWQANYQILLIILLKEFIELNVNMDMRIKNVQPVELNRKIVTAFLNTQTVKMN